MDNQRVINRFVNARYHEVDDCDSFILGMTLLVSYTFKNMYTDMYSSLSIYSHWIYI